MKEKKPINDMLDSAMQNIAFLVDASKTVGKPIIIDANTAIIPISRVTYGFGTGGSEFNTNKKKKKENEMYFESGEELFPFGGGSLGGVYITPEAFLYVSKDEIKLIRINEDKSLYEKVFDLVKEVIKDQKK